MKLIFSVIIPTFRRPAKLRETLDSLFFQTIPPEAYEILVCDNDNPQANEETKKIIGDLSHEHGYLRYLWEPKPGPAAARNIGIKNALGQICAFTDDDILVPLDWLEKILDGFKRYPEVVGVGGRMEPPPEWLRTNPIARFELNMTYEVYGLTPEREEFVAGVETPIGATNNIAYKREALVQVGGFDSSFLPHIYGEEKDLKERLVKKGFDKFLYIPLRVIHRRRYDWKSFLSHSFNDGIGTRYYNSRNKIKASRLRLFFHLIINLITLPARLLAAQDRPLEVLKAIYKFQVVMAQILPEKMIVKLELE